MKIGLTKHIKLSSHHKFHFKYVSARSISCNVFNKKKQSVNRQNTKLILKKQNAKLWSSHSNSTSFKKKLVYYPS